MEIPEGLIDLLRGNDNEDKASSGMHWPNEDVSGWDVQNVADDEDTVDCKLSDIELENILGQYFDKKALGLTDIPASIGQSFQVEDGSGSEVLGSSGVPQNPGLSREDGDDEETDFYGAIELIEPKSSIPGKNEKYQDNKAAQLKYISGLKNIFMGLGMGDKAEEVEIIIKKSNILDEYIARYKNTRKALENAASKNSIKMDYDIGFMTGEVSFLFENGKWTYDHSIAPEISNPSVEDIASGKVDPTLIGGLVATPGGMSEEYMRLISGLASSYNNDLPGGIIYLYENRGTGSFDATFPSEIPSMFYEIYKTVKSSLDASGLEDLDAKIGATKKNIVFEPEKKQVIVAPTARVEAPEILAGTPTWENSGLVTIREPWRSYATKEGLDQSLAGFLSWHDANYARLGIRTKSKILTFLSGDSGEKNIAGPSESSYKTKVDVPISTNNQEIEVEKTSARTMLEKTIKEILDGRVLGPKVNNRMSRYIKRVGGSEENLKPLIDQIIVQIKPAELLEMLQDPEKKYRSVLRQARKAARIKILEEGK
jgi:hypothetical protein